MTQYPDRDQALLEVAKAVRAAAERLGGTASGSASAPATAPTPPADAIRPAGSAGVGPRSSTLALARSFTDRDKDAFKLETFEYIARYFENSAAELTRRNPGIGATFRRIDANRFSTIVYRDGQSVARCSVFMGDRPFGSGIAYSSSDTASNSYNEQLQVEADDHGLYLVGFMAAAMGRRGDVSHLTQEGAAELYWQMLIGPLQPRR